MKNKISAGIWAALAAAVVASPLAAQPMSVSFNSQVNGGFKAINDNATVMRKKIAASPYEDLAGLTALWIKDDFSNPRDKELVTDEMNRLLAVATNRAELIELRVMLDNAKAESSRQLGIDSDYLPDNCKNIREADSRYANLTDAQIIKMARANQSFPDLGATSFPSNYELVQLAMETIRTFSALQDKDQKKMASIVKELKVVDSRLAELNSGL